MEKKRDRAIVLKAVPYEERHRIVTAISENHGRITALARNAFQSRRFGGSLEVFTASEWLFVERPGADLFRLEEAHVRRDFSGVRKDFQRLTIASFFSELMFKAAPERESCRDLFALHANALAHLDELSLEGDQNLEIINAYLVKLLHWAGTAPQTQFCLHCERPVEMLEPHEPITCLVAEAGWVCVDCKQKDSRHIIARHGERLTQASLRVTPAALLDSSLAAQVPLRQFHSVMQASRKEHENLYLFLEALLQYHFPGFDRGSLKSAKFLGLQSNLQLQEGWQQ